MQMPTCLFSSLTMFGYRALCISHLNNCTSKSKIKRTFITNFICSFLYNKLYLLIFRNQIQEQSEKLHNTASRTIIWRRIYFTIKQTTKSLTESTNSQLQFDVKYATSKRTLFTKKMNCVLFAMHSIVQLTSSI